MHENNSENTKIRLIDEALASEPIKNTFRLAWEFIVLNRNFTLTLMGLFIGFHLLGMIPVLALVFMVFAGVFGLAIQIYIGRVFYQTSDINNYLGTIKESRIDMVSYTSIAPAFGAYLGGLFFLFLIAFLFGIVANSMGLIQEGMSESDLTQMIASLGMPMILTMLVLLYLQPLVQANIILAKNFSEGFKAVFTIFSINLWKKAFQKSYFSYVVILGIILLSSIFMIVLLLNIVENVSGLALVTNIILLGCMYLFMIITAIGSMMAKRLVE
jgi:hypothetical protein